MHDYIRAMPSQHYSVRELGRALPLFVEHYFSGCDDLIELTRLEWTLVSVLFFEQEAVLTLRDLNVLSEHDWPTYQFRLIKAHQRIQLHAKVARYFDLECRDEVTVLVWKRQNKAFYQALSVEDACLLNYFAAGLDFALVCEKMAEYFPQGEGESFIFQRLQFWLEQEIFNN